MYTMRKWSVRHARALEWVYDTFASLLLALDPLWRRIGYQRLEKPVAKAESMIKGFMFDCQMCGACVLTHTGMSCPMNCPKMLRNGPCGGVRPDGTCEVKPDMPCVWVAAFAGSRIMRKSELINEIIVQSDASQSGTSSWLRVTREAAASRRPGAKAHDADLMRGRA
jgi:hypothetical protein